MATAAADLPRLTDNPTPNQLDQYFHDLTTGIQQIANRLVPKGKGTTPRCEWWIEQIESLIKDERWMHRRWKEDRTQTAQEAYKQAEAAVKREIRKSKTKSWRMGVHEAA